MENQLKKLLLTGPDQFNQPIRVPDHFRHYWYVVSADIHLHSFSSECFFMMNRVLDFRGWYPLIPVVEYLHRRQFLRARDMYKSGRTSSLLIESNIVTNFNI